MLSNVVFVFKIFDLYLMFVCIQLCLFKYCSLKYRLVFVVFIFIIVYYSLLVFLLGPTPKAHLNLARPIGPSHFGPK